MVMTNTGRELHHQQLLTVPEGMATEDLIAGLVSGEAGPPPPGVEAAGSVGAIGPGATGITTLNMTAGDYLIVCFIPNAEGVPHMALGMIKPITVIESSAPVAALPEAKVSIDMVDLGFGLSGAISAGLQNISVTNKREQEHEAFLIRLAPNATAMVFVGAFAPDAPPGPPPGEALGGFQSIAPGGGGTFNVNVTPGNYAFLCFVEDPNTGAPHFALGMLEEFSIQYSVERSCLSGRCTIAMKSPRKTRGLLYG